jgi:hypothetical protein
VDTVISLLRIVGIAIGILALAGVAVFAAMTWLLNHPPPD